MTVRARKTTGQGDWGTLRRVILRHVGETWTDDALIDGSWRALNYTARPDRSRAIAEYDRFAGILGSRGVAVDLLPGDGGLTLDAIYTRDAAVACDRGLILCSMGKEARRAEPADVGRRARALGLNVLGAIEPPGRLEGGDVAWLSERVVAVGRGARTNAEGIRQLRHLLGDCVDEVVEIPLPDVEAPGDVFHLMSIFSPVDSDLALVFPPLVPVELRDALAAHGMATVEVPDAEFLTMGCNVLAIAPRVCLMLEGNPLTRTRLEAAGAEAIEYDGTEISMKGCGGPTCLTRPVVRDRAAPGSRPTKG